MSTITMLRAKEVFKTRLISHSFLVQVNMFSKLRGTGPRDSTTKITTVDPKEIQHFNNMASQWWNKSGICGPLHLLNDFRISLIHSRLKEMDVRTQGLAVLDVGCGGGLLSEGLSHLGCNITGLDASQELIDVAQHHADIEHLPNLKYVCSTIQDFAVQNKEKFDFVVSSEVIEHVTEKEHFVKSCVQCLKPGGSIFMTTPNQTWFSWFAAIFLMEYIFKSTPRGTHTYDMFIHLDDLKRLFKEENCRTIYTSGFIYNPFKKEWSLIDNTNYFAYIVHAVKIS